MQMSDALAHDVVVRDERSVCIERARRGARDALHDVALRFRASLAQPRTQRALTVALPGTDPNPQLDSTVDRLASLPAR